MNIVEEQRLRSRVRQYRASKIPFRHFRRRAAVAIVFTRGKDNTLEFLMIRRAVNKTDPWSGQMAFPGGRLDTIDAGAFTAAKRECEEELQLELDELVFLGRLSDRMTRKSGRRLPLLITPYVFFAEEKPELKANYEVASIHWLPFEYFLRPPNRQFRWVRYQRKRIRLPYYLYGDCLVWGLSLAMFDELLSVYKTKGKVGRLF